MTKEKVTALVIVAFLIAGVNSGIAALQVKPGAKCEKAGITQTVADKKYTCIKSGKKLLWNKGVNTTKLLPTPIPTPTLIPTPTPTSTPTPIPTFPNIVFPAHNVGTGLCDAQKKMNKLGNRAKSEYVKITKEYSTLWEKYNISEPKSLREVDQAAIASFQTYISRKRVSSAEVRIFMQPDLTDDVSMQRLYRQLVAVGDLFGTGFDISSFEKPITMVAFKDWIWLRDEYISLGCGTSEAQDLTNDPKPYSAFSGLAITSYQFVIFNFSGYPAKIGNFSMTGLGAHEMFHLIQFQLANTGYIDDGKPGLTGWFVEGGASLVSELTSNYLKEGTFQYTKQAANNIFQSGEARLLNLEDTDGTNWIYNMGLLGSDFLVSIVGFEKFVNIWSEMGKGKVFSDAFQDATGIELKDFYKMFYEIRRNMGMG